MSKVPVYTIGWYHCCCLFNRKEVGTLQSKLVTTQQQLVEVNDKKETETTDTMKLREHIKKLQIELESLHKTQTGSLQDVVDNLKKEWEKEEKTKIVSAIETARAGWMKERESEWKNRVRERECVCNWFLIIHFI